MLQEKTVNSAVVRRNRQEYFKQYHILNRERRYDNACRHYILNKSKKLQQAKKWARKNPLKRSIIMRKSRIKHHDEYQITRKEWDRKNKDKIRLSNQRMRHRRRLDTPLSIKTIQKVYEDNIKKYGTLTCYLCKKAIAFRNDSIDHKIPITRGGTHEKNNLEIACRKCNSKKNNRTLQEYKILTSITCPKCGTVDKESRATRDVFKCVSCKHTDHADRNAALNVALKGILNIKKDKS